MQLLLAAAPADCRPSACLQQCRGSAVAVQVALLHRARRRQRRRRHYHYRHHLYSFS